MNERIQIFPETGGISFADVKDSNIAYVTITPVLMKSSSKSIKARATGSSGNSKNTSALFANMPITGVVINQGVDMSISKTLNSDFLVSEFGDHPVQITLAGIDFYGTCEGGRQEQHKQIMDFYEQNKLSTNINNRIDISITPASSPNSGAFRCILMKLRTTAPAMEGQGLTPAYRYEMNLIGVRRTK